MEISLRPENHDAIVGAFQRDGYVILDDVDPRPADTLTGMLCDLAGLTPEQVHAAGRAGAALEVTPEMRLALARGNMTPELQSVCHDVLGDLLVRLVGPLVHTSKTFHYQMKQRSTSQVILKGYHEGGTEVQALYGLHNEFTAARVLTSPSAIVCWVPLNDFEGPALHLYPGSHRKGLLTNRWLSRQVDEGVSEIGEPIEYHPKRGQLVIFHFLTMHGSGAATDDPLPEVAGDPVRISCDLRFFPFCGVLDSPATALRDRPLEWIDERVASETDDLLLGPLYETLAYFGREIAWPDLPDGSVAHWARFIEGLVRGDEAQRRDAIAQLVNVDIGFDPLESYQERYAPAELTQRPYRSVSGIVPEAEVMLGRMAAAST